MKMTFTIKDRDGLEDDLGLPEFIELTTLEEFTEWAVSVELPRFEFVPPESARLGGRSDRPYNPTNHWMLYLASDYD